QIENGVPSSLFLRSVLPIAIMYTKKPVSIIIIPMSSNDTNRLSVDISDNNNAAKLIIGNQRNGTEQTRKIT
ncbi:MAG: hypothetical protein KAU48_10050, partial [Candidatus Thorarchaeota archaeon]|nr:hypothetical protein [Candidatus Thorarchaeota archaeon]